eukprot:1714284-Prymnesium_polylepis.1
MERPEYLDPDTMEPRVKNIHMPPGTRGARVRRDGGAACDEKRRLCLHEMIGGGLHPLLLAAGQWSNPKPRGKIGAKTRCTLSESAAGARSGGRVYSIRGCRSAARPRHGGRARASAASVRSRGGAACSASELRRCERRGALAAATGEDAAKTTDPNRAGNVI